MSSAPLDRKCQDGKIFLICIPCPAQCFRHDRQARDIVFIVDTSCIVVRIIGQLLFFLTMRENKQEGKEEEEEKEEEKDKDEEEEKEK